jgi:hypothetical protein
MNPEDKISMPQEHESVSSEDRPEAKPSGPWVEHSEFESLLQRAMEILSAKAERAAPTDS